MAEESLDRDDSLISLRSATHLLEASAEVTGCGDFGLRLSTYQSVDVLGPVSIVLRNAPTVRAAVDDVIRYLFVHSPGIVVSLNERDPIVKDTVAMSIDIRLSGAVAMHQNCDLCLADAHNFMRLFVGSKYDLRAVSIPHERIVSRARCMSASSGRGCWRSRRAVRRMAAGSARNSGSAAARKTKAARSKPISRALRGSAPSAPAAKVATSNMAPHSRKRAGAMRLPIAKRAGLFIGHSSG